jgi:hypothetical protein
VPLLHATREAGEPGAAFPFGFDGGTVWFRWTAPEGGAYAFEVSSQGRVDLYTGETLAALKALTYSASRHTIRVAAGETLRLSVAPYYQATSAGEILRLQKVTPPANDDFAQREVLTGVPVTFFPRTRHATFDTSDLEAPLGPLREPSGVWYEWAAPFAGEFTLAGTENYGAYWSVRRTQGEELEADASRFTAEAGEVFHFLIYAYGGEGVSGAFTVRPSFVPPNDAFVQRVTLTGAVVRVIGTTEGATREPLEPPGSGENTVWYSWAAPGDGRLLVELDNGYSMPRPRLFIGEELVSLEPHGGSSRFDDRFDFRVQAGVTYQLAFSPDNNFSYAGEFRSTLRFAPRPANDDFDQRARVFGSRASGTTKGATYEAGEGDWPDEFAGSTWWTWTAPRTGLYQIEVTGDVPPRDFGVFTGTNREELAWALEDAPELGLGVRRFYATRGTAYALQFGTDEPGGGDYRFTIAPVRPPANDHFTNATRLRGRDQTVRGRLRFASVEEVDEELGFSDGRSLWWRWTAPADGMVFLKLQNTAQVMEIYQGDSLEELVGWTISDHRVEAPVQAGREYRFRVHLPVELPPGNEAVSFSLRSEPAPANDRFENRLTLTGATVTARGTLLGAGGFDEPPGVEDGYPTAWWRWVVPATGRYTITARGTVLTPGLQAFLGDTRDGLTRLPVAYPKRQLAQGNFLFQAGDVVSIAVSTVDVLAFGGDVQLTIHPTGSPLNDHFAARAELVDGHASSPVEGASREPGEPGFDEDPLGASLWWRFTPASNGWHQFSARLTHTNDLSLDPAPAPELVWLNAFTGDSLTNLTPLAFWTGEPQVQRLLLTAGQEYVLQISDHQHRLGRVDVLAQFKPAPINDHFANALVMTGATWSQDFTNAWATAEPDEPVFPEGENSLWWRWTAPTGSSHYVYMYSHRGGVLRVHTGAELGALSPVVSIGTSVFPAYLPAEAGQTYHFSYRNGSSYEGSVRIGVGQWNSPNFASSPSPARALRLTAEPNRVIETSTNLVDWTPWRTNSSAVPFAVPLGVEPQRFFRVR